MILAHPGEPLTPHHLWGAWNVDPTLIAGILVVIGLYWSGRRRDRRRANNKDACFAGAIAAIAVALLSPLDALAGVLASAHMVQHLLLILVAAPLLTLSAPWPALLRGAPRGARRTTARWRRRARLTRRNTRLLRHPATAWLLHVGTVWFWHATVPYQAALDHEIIHELEHATFFATALLFWAVVVRLRHTAPGFGILLVFATAMQNVFLSALLTFANAPWYPGYAHTTQAWNLEPLADQQLAGVIMWIPAGVVYLATALTLLVAWIRQSEPAGPAISGPVPVGAGQPPASQPDREFRPQQVD